MESISTLWDSSRALFETKKIHQIISFVGEGKITDGNNTSTELREILSQIPTKLLKRYSEECLTEKFTDSGFVLQDIVNQIGERLGFEIEYGFYRGTSNRIGYDGIWTSENGINLIIEVKTTDAYRINLDTVSQYREELIKTKRINEENSSLLITVGRQDTGDLEAQIRGSRHAWDIRLISIDYLLRLLEVKEKLNDPKTTQQIIGVLQPMEYTKLDKLIELIFLTTQDLELEKDTGDIDTENEDDQDIQEKIPKFTPVNFHDDCLDEIIRARQINYLRQGRVSFYSKDKQEGFIISVSKLHKTKTHDGKYWFAFHLYQKEYLKNFQTAFCAYGCGDSSKLFLIPFSILDENLDNLWTTEREDRMYWHIVIYEDSNSFRLQIPKKKEFMIIDEYRLISTV